MKRQLLVLLSLISVNAFAADKIELARLRKIIGTKTLSCQPVNPPKKIDARYKGDDGFFKIKFHKNYIVVFDNGGSGFGFANGDIRDLHVGDEDLFLSVGDDGYQILTLHIADFGSDKPDCAEGRLVSYWDGYHSGGDKTDAIKCCLR